MNPTNLFDLNDRVAIVTGGNGGNGGNGGIGRSLALGYAAAGASHVSDFVTGALIPVDGGYSIR